MPYDNYTHHDATTALLAKLPLLTSQQLDHFVQATTSEDYDDFEQAQSGILSYLEDLLLAPLVALLLSVDERLIEASSREAPPVRKGLFSRRN